MPAPLRIIVLSVCLMTPVCPALAQQASHPHQALSSEQKQQQAFPMLGLKMFIEVDSEKTNGTVAVVRAYVPPKSGPPPHVHSREDEVHTIVRGHYRFRHGDTEFDAPPGTTLFLPRNVPHVFRNISEEPGEHIVTLIPGGLEKMFREISAAQIELPRDIEKLTEISAKYGIKNMAPGSMPLSGGR
jgi:mannose-6-phosphate isomerase-like protein (cupin superfamily)